LAAKRETPHSASQDERLTQKDSVRNNIFRDATLASLMMAIDTTVLTSALATARPNFGAPMDNYGVCKPP
jgi:hypothetical protein